MPPRSPKEVWIFDIESFLPFMVERGYGHIVNTSSGMGLCAMPGTPACCSPGSDAAGSGEAFRAEVRRYGIGSTPICPGVIISGIVCGGFLSSSSRRRAAREHAGNICEKSGRPTERVAGAVLDAVRKNSSMVPVVREAWLQWLTKRIS